MDFSLSAGMLEHGALVFVRLLSVLSTAPVFGHRSVAMPIKVGLAFGLTIVLLMPMQQSFIPFADGLTFLLALAGEVLIGLLIGFVSMLVFYALEMAGGIIGMEMGLYFAFSISPTLPSQGGMMQQFYVLLSILIFLSMNGHHAFLLALSRTLEAVPPGSFMQSDVVPETLIRLSSAIFPSALQIALPVLAALVLTDLALALMNRVMPRIYVFVLGMPLKMGVGLATLLVTLPLTVPLVRQTLEQVARNMLLIAR
ncbi:MAG TPA: flagellar biosynthetic protein FliR [Caldilineae bacterium]|nr:flagellar biosynthetic protein FliR [Caldilineae bacterium]